MVFKYVWLQRVSYFIYLNIWLFYNKLNIIVEYKLDNALMQDIFWMSCSLNIGQKSFKTYTIGISAEIKPVYMHYNYLPHNKF